MNKEPIKQIKSMQLRSVNFVLSAIIIACGINFVVTGIINYIDSTGDAIYIIIGCILIILPVLIFVIYAMINASSKINIDCVITYDENNKQLVEIPRYNFSEELVRYLVAACKESNDIKSLWQKDSLRIKTIKDKDNNNRILPSEPANLLNQLIEYIILEELSLVTTDFFNNENINKNKVISFNKMDITDLLATNSFLNLFSKPMNERAAFVNRNEENIIMAYSSNGAIYNKFELQLPKRCKIYRKRSNVIEVKHPLFTMDLKSAFMGFNTSLPRHFGKNYLHKNVHNIESYEAEIEIELKLSWKAFLIHKSKYYEWIDHYIEHLIKKNSFAHFINKINWDLVETILECNRKDLL